MKASPLAQVKDRFNDKAGLVAAVKELATDDLWRARLNEDKGWSTVSNAKLLRLHEVLSTVKKDYGSRAKLIDAILGAEKRTKDDGYKARLDRFSTPRLLDHLKGAKTREKAAAPKAAAPAKAPAKAKAAKATKAAPKAKKAKPQA
jgi:hypothetical protein